MARTNLEMLNAILWRLRDALDQLAAHLGRDGLDCELLFRTIASLELHRAITTRELAAGLGLAGEPKLTELMAAVPPEWAAAFAGHRLALLRSTAAADRSLVHRDMPETVDVTDGGLGARTSGPRATVQRSLVDFLA